MEQGLGHMAIALDEGNPRAVTRLGSAVADGRYYVFVRNMDAKNGSVRIYRVKDERHGVCSVTDLASAVLWHHLMSEFLARHGASIRYFDYDSDAGRHYALYAVLEHDDHDYCVFAVTSANGTSEVRYTVCECTVEDGLVRYEQVEDAATLEAVIAATGNMIDDDEGQHPNVTLTIDGVETECEFIGIVEHDDKSYAVLMPLAANNTEGECLVYRYTVDQNGDEHYEDVSDDVFARIRDTVAGYLAEIAAAYGDDDEDDEPPRTGWGMPTPED